MGLHAKEVSELARKEQTLGKYLVDKIGGELRGEQGDVRGELELEISEVPITNLEAIEKHIIDFYKSHGFEVEHHQDNQNFELHFVDNEERIRAMVISYFEDSRMIRVTAIKIGPK